MNERDQQIQGLEATLNKSLSDAFVGRTITPELIEPTAIP